MDNRMNELHTEWIIVYYTKLIIGYENDEFDTRETEIL